LCAQSSLNLDATKGMDPEFLVVGHVTKDLDRVGGYVIGGTATYSSLTAQRLGRPAAVVTSASDDLDIAARLPGIQFATKPAPESTTFENIYQGDYRHQYVRGVASPLDAADVPLAWRRTPMVLLGPLVREMGVDMAHLFSGSLLGVTAQGWMRRWDDQGLVHAREWVEASEILPLADVLFFSYEDVDYDLERVREYAALAEMAVVTHNRLGAVVHCMAGSRWIPAYRANTVDPTGAGDVFAAAYLVALADSGDPYQAARFANCAAAIAIEGRGISTIPTRDQVDERLARGELVDDISARDYNMIRSVLI
jgi:1D-myo-inositol 3-kinase